MARKIELLMAWSGAAWVVLFFIGVVRLAGWIMFIVGFVPFVAWAWSPAQDLEPLAVSRR